MAQQLLSTVGRLGLGASALAFVLPQVLYDVDGGERAVMVDARKGILPKPIGEGTHFKIPYFQAIDCILVLFSYPLLLS
jgi:prohibitin 1